MWLSGRLQWATSEIIHDEMIITAMMTKKMRCRRWARCSGEIRFLTGLLFCFEFVMIAIYSLVELEGGLLGVGAGAAGVLSAGLLFGGSSLVFAAALAAVSAALSSVRAIEFIPDGER